jgi:hypothetical protein
MRRRVFERVLSEQVAAIRLCGSVYYYSSCNALGIDVQHGMKASATFGDASPYLFVLKILYVISEFQRPVIGYGLCACSRGLRLPRTEVTTS